MPQLPNPWYLLGSVALVIAAFAFGSSHGHHTASVEYQLKIDKLNLHVADLNEQARAVEQSRSEQINGLATKLSKAQTDAQNRFGILDAGLRSGAIRLSVPTSNQWGIQPTQGSTIAARSGDQTRTYLDPAFAESLVAITDEGDSAIRQLNTCIDSYNIIRGQVNATE